MSSRTGRNRREIDRRRKRQTRRLRNARAIAAACGVDTVDVLRAVDSGKWWVPRRRDFGVDTLAVRRAVEVHAARVRTAR